MNKNKCSQKNKVNENVCRIFLKKGKKKNKKKEKKEWNHAKWKWRTAV